MGSKKKTNQKKPQQKQIFLTGIISQLFFTTALSCKASTSPSVDKCS